MGAFSFFSDRGFRRLLVRYLCLVMVPALLICVCAALVLKEYLMTTQIQKIQSALNSAQNQVNYSLERVDSICVRIDQSESVVPSLLARNAYSRVNVCKLLGNYAIMDPMYTGLCAFYAQTPHLIYSPVGTEPIEGLYQYQFFSGDQPIDAQLGALKARKLVSNLSATDATPQSAALLRYSHSLLYICPAGLFDSAAVTMLLRINSWRFYDAYEEALSALEDGDYAMLTYDSSGEIVGMSGMMVEGETLISPEWLAAQRDERGLIAIRVDSEHFSNELLVRRSAVESFIAPQLRAGYGALAGLLLLALLACLAAARQSYRPVALLRKSILDGISEMPIDASELQHIDHSILEIILSYNHREEQSRNILGMMKQQLIYWALMNNLPQAAHTEQLLKMAGLQKPNMLFCVMAVHLPAGAAPDLVNGLCSDILQTDWNHISATPVFVEAHDTLAVVFHMFVELDTRARQEYAANTLKMILDQYGLAAGIGVGLSQPSLYTLHRSYLTARRAMSEGGAPWRLFEDIRSEENDRFSALLGSLSQKINDGQGEKAREDLEKCFQMLGELDRKGPLFQFQLSRLLGEIARPLVEMGIWRASQLDNEIERLMYMDLQQLYQALSVLFDQIGANAPLDLAEPEPSGWASVLENTYRDLKDNALDPMLNINLEAEKFSLSTAILNRRFRQRYGRTMVNFVSEIRMERAKELLRNGDMRIKDIVTAVGYYDVPNFSRKFKAMTGMTPGQYRAKARGEETVDQEE